VRRHVVAVSGRVAHTGAVGARELAVEIDRGRDVAAEVLEDIAYSRNFRRFEPAVEHTVDIAAVWRSSWDSGDADVTPLDLLMSTAGEY
jgi:hypothetical protein